jgi:hypothetical protein
LCAFVGLIVFWSQVLVLLWPWLAWVQKWLAEAEPHTLPTSYYCQWQDYQLLAFLTAFVLMCPIYYYSD